MKTLFNIFICLALLASTSAYAGKGELFEVDEAAIEQEFQDLERLESYVDTQEELTWSELQANHQDFLATSELGTLELNAPLGTAFTLDDMDWGAFAWGFCCCPIGFFVVAINQNKDQNQKISFWIGWGVSFLISSISSALQAATVSTGP